MVIDSVRTDSVATRQTVPDLTQPTVWQVQTLLDGSV